MDSSRGVGGSLEVSKGLLSSARVAPRGSRVTKVSGGGTGAIICQNNQHNQTGKPITSKHVSRRIAIRLSVMLSYIGYAKLHWLC